MIKRCRLVEDTIILLTIVIVNKMSVADLLSPLPKNWLNINVNSINVGSGGVIGGPFHITETIGTGPSTITGDVGTFNGQLDFSTTNLGINYTLVGPQVTSGDEICTVKMYASNAPDSTSGFLVDGSCKIQTFTPGSFIALNPNGTSAFAVTENGVQMPIQQYLEVSLSAGIPIPDGTVTPVTTMTQIRSVGTITYDPITGIFTIPFSGMYTISFSGTWQGGLSGTTGGYISITGNGSLFANTTCASTNAVSNSSSMTRFMPGSTQFKFNVIQSSGASFNLVEAHVMVFQNA